MYFLWGMIRVPHIIRDAEHHALLGGLSVLHVAPTFLCVSEVEDVIEKSGLCGEGWISSIWMASVLLLL
jgi:hypothetical protein